MRTPRAVLPLALSTALVVGLTGPAQAVPMWVAAHPPQLAADPAGDVVAVWARFNGSHYQVQASRRPRHGAWSPAATPFPSNTHDADAPEIALDAQGNGAVVWLSYDSFEERAVAAGLNAAGPISRVTKPTVKTVQSKRSPSRGR